MRVLLLAFAALAACSSDPVPVAPDASSTDAAPAFDASPAEAAVDALPGAPDAADVPSLLPDAPAPAEAAVDVAPEASGPCVDRDGDGFGAGCATGPDCDDTNRDIHPGAMELCDGIDDNCDGRNDGDADGGVDPLAQAHCVAVWPYGADAAVPPTCQRPFATMPCGTGDGFACVGCRRAGECFRQTQRPGQTVDTVTCTPRS